MSFRLLTKLIEKNMDKKKIITIVSIVIVLLVVGVVIWYSSPKLIRSISSSEKAKTVEEILVIPETTNVEVSFGRTPTTDKYKVPLTPASGGDRVIVPNATLTLKDSFNLALPNALAWASDADLIYLTSGGAVTLEGKSSQWQVTFGSSKTKKGYEIIIQGDKIVSEKEILSTEYGYSLPGNWYDADEAIKSIQTLPQFIGATISSINFFYNIDGERWGYALGTSNGTTSMPVR